METMNFGDALKQLKVGGKVARLGWNGGVGIYIELQVPDDGSKMTFPYIYIDTTALDEFTSVWAPKGRVPWAPGQADVLAEDWCLVEWLVD